MIEKQYKMQNLGEMLPTIKSLDIEKTFDVIIDHLNALEEKPTIGYYDSRTKEERENEPETVMTTAGSDINDLLDTHFEEQRIHDLKIDVDRVIEEAIARHILIDNHSEDCLPHPEISGCAYASFIKNLKWFKEIL